MSSARRSKARAVEPTERAAPRASPKPQTAPLPVPLTETGVAPVPSETAQLDADLGELKRAVDNPFVLAKYKPADVARLHDRFVAVSQPATAEQIAHKAGRLVVSVPLAGNIDPGVLADAICEEIAERQVTRFELAIAIRSCRRRCQFLSVANVVEELERARGRSCRYGAALGLAEERLPDIPKELERHRQQAAEWRDKQRKDYERIRSKCGGELPWWLLRQFADVLDDDDAERLREEEGT